MDPRKDRDLKLVRDLLGGLLERAGKGRNEIVQMVAH